jgi:Zn-dependent M28 family amino/carboxypeptidase
VTASSVPLPADEKSTLEQDVQALASNSTQGRDNNTPGSLRAQRFLIEQLQAIGIGANRSQSGSDAFKQPIPGGTNLVALIPGGDLAEQYVIVGAHYDHIGALCRTMVATDHICNGATDNAAGVANVLSIGREIAARPNPPRRTVVLALWDREEDGLLGSQFFIEHPLVPLAQTAGYVNYDNQGSNLLPSLQRTTFAIGAETGGSHLSAIVQRAATQSPLQASLLSAVFGQNRSDYKNFIAAGVPTVFYTDATGPCYHTTQDEVDTVDFVKLGFEAAMGSDVVDALASDDQRPTFTSSAPVATYADATAVHAVAKRGLADVGRFDPAGQSVFVHFVKDLESIVARGSATFGSADAVTMLLGAAKWVALLNSGPCNGFLQAAG